MPGYLSLVLHAHLPYVRHPEHERFLEESWLFEAITETYLPLLEVVAGWQRDGIEAPLTFTLTPTLCAMLRDTLLRQRYRGHLDRLVELAGKEIHRTHFEPDFRAVAEMYSERLLRLRQYYHRINGDVVGAFRELQERGRIEIITCAATHALLPLLADHPPSLRAQILIGRDHYRDCFGRDPTGIWLPECAYVETVEPVLREANIRWFIIDGHGIQFAHPRPRYGVFAPVFTPNGLAAFGRDMESAKQVWSRQEGYPGDFRYRDFYRDVGFDLDLDYVRPYLPAPDVRGFTGLKYHRITGASGRKEVYQRERALSAADQHAAHFLNARMEQVRRLGAVMDRPPHLLSPYDAELFGHWWFEGPEFLNFFVRKTVCDQQIFQLTTPTEFLRRHPTQQVVRPAASSWGDEGYWRVWLDESNQWIQPHLAVARERMADMARNLAAPTPLRERALKQAARELLLAQASDWPFILRAGTSAGYARGRVTDHLLRFNALHEQLTVKGVDEGWLTRIEWMDNLFPELNWRHWA